MYYELYNLSKALEKATDSYIHNAYLVVIATLMLVSKKKLNVVELAPG